MSNLWAQEGEKYDTNNQQNQYADIRDVKFQDDSQKTVRFLPASGKDQVPFYGYIIHWIPQSNTKKGRPIIHPIDKKCCVCDYVHELWAEIHRLKEEDEMTDNSPEVKAVYSKIQPVSGKKRYDFNVIDRDEPGAEVNGKRVDLVPKRLSAVSAIWKDVFNYAKNEKWGNPSDEKTGYDFIITTEGEGFKRKYTISPERDNSPLTKEEKEVLKLNYDLEKLRKTTTLQDIKEILENAKAPYNEIISLLDGSSYEVEEEEKPVKSKKKEVEEPEVKEKEEVKEEPKVEEKKEKTKKEEPKEVEEPEEKEDEVEEPEEKEDEVEEPEVVEEETEDKKSEEENKEDDENDLNSYECKGEYEEGNESCDGDNENDPCPAREDCKKFVPYYKKAKELKIDVENTSIDDIKKEIEKKTPKSEEKEEKPVKGKRKKSIPF